MNARLRCIQSAELLLAAVALCLINGCASMPSGGSYSLKQTRDDVDWAMVRYHNRLSFGFISTAERDQVTAAYKAYQAAFNQAVRESQSDYAAPTPDNVKQLADQPLSILAAIP